MTSAISVADHLIAITQSAIMPAFYLIFAATLSTACLAVVRRRFGLR